MAVAEDFSFEERKEQERMVLESVERFLDKDVAPYAHDLEEMIRIHKKSWIRWSIWAFLELQLGLSTVV